MSKPEYQGPPEVYYNKKEARKYTSNSRIQQVCLSLFLFKFWCSFLVVPYLFVEQNVKNL